MLCYFDAYEFPDPYLMSNISNYYMLLILLFGCSPHKACFILLYISYLLDILIDQKTDYLGFFGATECTNSFIAVLFLLFWKKHPAQLGRVWCPSSFFGYHVE